MPKALQRARLEWLREHRGILSRIAREVTAQTGLKRSPSMVSKVFWDVARTRDGAIERALADIGAPGFTTGG